jgi:hypothetical protein
MFRYLPRASALILMVGAPLAALILGAARLVPFLAMPLFVLGGPMLFSLWHGDSELGPGTDDEGGSDGGGGGGTRRPGRPPMRPSGPRGVLPLERSRPASWRLRGSEPQRVSDPGPRREPHRPRPAPRRSPIFPHTH